MLSGRVNLLFSYLLIVVFTFISIPKELIHELHHDDSIHHSCSIDFSDFKIEDHHIHCDYLKIEVQLFHFNSYFNINYFTFNFSSFLVKENLNFQLQKKEIFQLRGPPALIA